MGILVTIAAALMLLAITFVLYSAICLFRNYHAARAIGVPVRIILFDHINPLWMLVNQPVVSFLERLPFGLARFFEYNYLGWECPVRWKAHYEMGGYLRLMLPIQTLALFGHSGACHDCSQTPSRFPSRFRIHGNARLFWAEYRYCELIFFLLSSSEMRSPPAYILTNGGSPGSRTKMAEDAQAYWHVLQRYVLQPGVAREPWSSNRYGTLLGFSDLYRHGFP